MMLSFIIPAYNEEAAIGATLDSIHHAAKAAGEPYEIVVVNDASTDRTAEIAERRGARVVHVEKRQIAAARNAGAKAANGEVFVFVDADTCVTDATIAGVLKALKKGAVGGGALVRFENVPLGAHLFGRVLIEFFWLFRYAAGCFVFARRAAFQATGGFDERYFASEEIWISRALKRQGKFVVVRAPVITSGRKIRDHGTLKLLWTMFKLSIQGPRRLQRREGLDIWYDGRREVITDRKEKPARGRAGSLE